MLNINEIYAIAALKIDSLLLIKEGESFHIEKYFKYIIDPTNNLTIEEITALKDEQFSSINNNRFRNPIHKNITIWLRLDIHNNRLENYYIGLHFPLASAFLHDSLDNFREILLGTQDPNTYRNQDLPLPFLKVPPKFKSTIYFRLKPKNYFSLGNPSQHHFDFTLNSQVGINNTDKGQDKNLIILGILLTVFFYHVVLFFFNSNISYLYLGLLALVFVIAQVFYTGLLEKWLNIPYNFHYDVGSIAIIFTCWPIMMPFTIHYLNLKQQMPKIRLFLTVLGWYLFCFYFILFIVQFIAPDLIRYTKFGDIIMGNSLIIATASNFLLLITGLIAYKDGQKMALYYVIAIGVLVLDTMWNIVTISYDASFTGLSFLLLSFGLARQFKSLQDERIEAEKQNVVAHQLRDIEIKERVRLQEINQFKTQLYTNITHEFRTPLTVISGIADQINNQPEEKELIQRNSRQLLDLVNQMLDLSKIDSGHLKPLWIQTDIVPLIKYLSESYNHLATSHHKAFSVQILEDSIWMDTDVKMFERILNNLAVNAIKFTPAGGHIDLRVTRDQDDNKCLISVRDTGRGIPEDQKSKIFDRFYQVDQTTTRQGQGTGIGLALVKELTEILGGNVSVASKLNEWTIFTVALPIKQTAEMKSWTAKSQTNKALHITKTKEPVGKANEEGKEHPKILIIEDHPDVRSYLRKLLITDYQLLEADNGKSGLSLAFDKIPDLIISDIMMPEMDGFTLCQQIKSDSRTSHIPIVLLTAKSTHDDRLQGLEEGADAYLTKPFDKRELFIRINKLLDGREILRMHYQQFKMLPKEQVQENSFLERIRMHIEDNFSNENYQIDELSSHLHLGRTQLYRKLKALTGRTFTDIVKEMKIHRAKELCKTDKTITEIAYELGFKDASYFSKVFKETTGRRPSDYRS